MYSLLMLFEGDSGGGDGVLKFGIGYFGGLLGFYVLLLGFVFGSLAFVGSSRHLSFILLLNP